MNWLNIFTPEELGWNFTVSKPIKFHASKSDPNFQDIYVDKMLL